MGDDEEDLQFIDLKIDFKDLISLLDSQVLFQMKLAGKFDNNRTLYYTVTGLPDNNSTFIVDLPTMHMLQRIEMHLRETYDTPIYWGNVVAMPECFDDSSVFVNIGSLPISSFL